MSAQSLTKTEFEAVDKTLQDIRSRTSVMGEVTVIIAGDFRRTVPFFLVVLKLTK